MKFHINDAGEAGQCAATQGNCPYGGSDAHYPTAIDAARAYEEIQNAHMERMMTHAMSKFPKNSTLTDAERVQALQELEELYDELNVTYDYDKQRARALEPQPVPTKEDMFARNNARWGKVRNAIEAFGAEILYDQKFVRTIDLMKRESAGENPPISELLANKEAAKALHSKMFPNNEIPLRKFEMTTTLGTVNLFDLTDDELSVLENGSAIEELVQANQKRRIGAVSLSDGTGSFAKDAILVLNLNKLREIRIEHDKDYDNTVFVTDTIPFESLTHQTPKERRRNPRPTRTSFIRERVLVKNIQKEFVKAAREQA